MQRKWFRALAEQQKHVIYINESSMNYYNSLATHSKLPNHIPFGFVDPFSSYTEIDLE